MSAPQRLPSLDGLRALSIGLVLFGHMLGTSHFPMRPVWLFDYGNVGVRVFFVISGYLITTLLLRELEKTGTVSIAEFYFRRSFRIFPAFYVYIGAVWTLSLLGVISAGPGDLLHAATYTTNYHYQRAWSLGHLWSLSVEEQFYLGWPLVLLLLGKRGGLRFAIAVMLLAPVVRVATLRWHLGDPDGIGESFQTVADAIAAGCVLACLVPELEASARYSAFQRSRAFGVVPALALGAAVYLRHGSTTLRLAFGETGLNVSVALLVHYFIRHPDGTFGRILNLRPLVYVGTISYSLYLWQQLFLNRNDPRMFASFPLNLVLAAACAVVSFHFIERPCLRLRERLDARVFQRKSSA